MKISIITVCLNCESTIEDTLKSVESQTYPDIEYIVVDGLSTDRTNEIVRNYSHIVNAHISERDKGLYDAMNKGISIATGDVIGILNSDDVFADDNVISKVANGFVGGVDAVFSDLIYVAEKDLTKATRLYSSKVFSRALIRYGVMLPHPTFYLRKKFYEDYGHYKTDYRVAADFELITRMATNELNMVRLPFISIKMREGGVSSRGLWGRVHQNFEIVRACRENGIYTNIFLVMLKLPYKISTLALRWFVR
ncbi:glycosyltransferase family 2 protein [Maricurvus nonylphenolicus]